MIMPLTVQKMFHNPYIYSGVVIARLTTCLATFLWAIIVMVHPIMLSEFVGDAMAGGIRIPQPWHTVLGAGAMAIAIFQLWSTVCWSPQRITTELVSLSMVILWTMASVGAWTMRDLHASGAACTTAVMFLSWWNMVSLPKRYY